MPGGYGWCVAQNGAVELYPRAYTGGVRTAGRAASRSIVSGQQDNAQNAPASGCDPAFIGGLRPEALALRGEGQPRGPSL